MPAFHIHDSFSPIVRNRPVHTRILAKSGETPLMWTRNYGMGRVFVTQIGHEAAVWDRKDVQHMIVEAIRWAMGPRTR